MRHKPVLKALGSVSRLTRGAFFPEAFETSTRMWNHFD
jgi:hypothetical protein